MTLIIRIIILGLSSALLSSGFPRCSSVPACRCKVQGNNYLTADCSGLGLQSTPLFYDGVITINLSQNQLQTFPDTAKLPTNLESLDISFNKMFGPNFKNMKYLRHLDLSGTTKLEYLPFDFFKYLPLLRTIDISSCGLFRFENGTFQTTKYLEELDISYNEDLTFRVLNNITYDLQFSKIKKLKANKIHHTFGTGTEVFVEDMRFFSNTSLVELHIDYNRLELFELGVISNLPSSLRYLSVGQNRLTLGTYFIELGLLKGVKEVNANFQFPSNDPKCLFPLVPPRSCDKPYERKCDNQLKLNGKEEILSKCGQFTGLGYGLHFFPIPLPKDMERLNFRRSALQYSLPRLQFAKNKVKYIDISYNFFYKWLGPITGFDSLESVDLSNNYCTEVSKVFFKNFTNLKSLKIDNNLLGLAFQDDNGEMFKYSKQLETLNLSSNRISYLHPNVFNGTVSLKKLDISNNHLNSWDFEIRHMGNLTHIDVSNNQIRNLSENIRNGLDKLRKDNNLTVAFAGNPILCKCDGGSLEFLKWIQNTDVLENKTQYWCVDNQGKTLSFRNLKNIIADLELRCISKTGLIIGVTVAILISIITLIAGLIYRYRWKIRYLYYIAVTKGLGYSYKVENGYERTYEYDIFVSYADEDVAFVKYEMLNKLENEKGLRLCIHHRDFIPGRDIAANIINAIHESRKTVLIVTPHFLKSKWCNFEFNMARMESIFSRDGKNNLFLVLLQDFSIRDLPMLMLELIESQSYIEYPNDPHGNIVFWDKIEEAVNL